MAKTRHFWYYDKRSETWMFGLHPNVGGGVYQEKDGWYGNSVPEHQDIISVGPYKTKLEAQLAVEADYDKRSKEA